MRRSRLDFDALPLFSFSWAKRESALGSSSADVMEMPAEHALPASAEVVVIGGGVAGVTTAYYLALAGVPVVLCEKGRIAVVTMQGLVARLAPQRQTTSARSVLRVA